MGPPRSGLARVLRRLALVAGAIAFSAVALEGGLRLLGVLARAAKGAARGSREPGPGGITVLCVGDSSVYGLSVREEETFPARLEVLINAGLPARPHRVVNEGIPGNHTGRALERLPEEISRHAPRAVVWLCGVNDAWGGPYRGRGVVGGCGVGLRVVRLARLLAFRFSPAGDGGRTRRSVVRTREGELLPVETVHRAESIEEPRLRLLFREALVRLRSLCAAARPLVVLYPNERLSHFAETNAALREAAAHAGVRVLETSAAIAAASAKGGAGAVYFPDYHLKPLGYEILARLVHDVLVEEGVLGGTLLGDPLAGLAIPSAPVDPSPPRDRARPDLRLLGGSRDPGDWSVEIRDLPGLSFRLLLSLGRTPGRITYGDHRVDLEPDSLWAAALGDPDLEGTFDSSGFARVPLRRALRAVRKPGRLFAAYAILRSEDDPWVLAVSGAVELVPE